jgi:hypothetical protein
MLQRIVRSIDMIEVVAIATVAATLIFSSYLIWFVVVE